MLGNYSYSNQCHDHYNQSCSPLILTDLEVCHVYLTCSSFRWLSSGVSQNLSTQNDTMPYRILFRVLSNMKKVVIVFHSQRKGSDLPYWQHELQDFFVLLFIYLDLS